MPAQAVALRSRPPHQHALSNLGAFAIRPALEEPREKLQARVPAIVQRVAGLQVLAGIGRIQPKNVQLLLSGQVGPHDADHDIDQSHHLRPSEFADPGNPHHAKLLALKQYRLRASARRVCRAVLAAQQARAATSTGSGRERCCRAERPYAYTHPCATGVASLDEDGSVMWTDCHPPNQP
jgi:hypothetical protein